MNDWLRYLGVHLDRARFADTIGAALAVILVLYLIGHLIAWVAR